MFKALWYFMAIGGCALFAEPPSPYDSIDIFRPFVDHGFYQNARQLRLLIDRYQIKVVVEVGSWLGQSTIDIAKALPLDGQVYAVDHWKGSIENQEGHYGWHSSLPFLYEQFLSNIIHIGLTHKITPIPMESLEAAAMLKIQPDLIYLDADRSFQAVLGHLNAWYPFVREKGILCGNHWLWPDVRAAVIAFAHEQDLSIEIDDNFWRLSSCLCVGLTD